MTAVFAILVQSVNVRFDLINLLSHQMQSGDFVVHVGQFSAQSGPVLFQLRSLCLHMTH